MWYLSSRTLRCVSLRHPYRSSENGRTDVTVPTISDDEDLTDKEDVELAKVKSKR